MPTNLEIVSPDRLLLSQPVDMVVIPAAEGEMGVLPGHAPMIVVLRSGAIALYEGDRVTQRLYVSGGFAEVTPERCTVLADMAVPTTELSRTKAQAQLAEAEAAMMAANKMDMDAVNLAMTRVQAAQAMVALAEAA